MKDQMKKIRVTSRSTYDSLSSDNSSGWMAYQPSAADARAGMRAIYVNDKIAETDTPYNEASEHAERDTGVHQAPPA
jgi:hypothetical protein